MPTPTAAASRACWRRARRLAATTGAVLGSTTGFLRAVVFNLGLVAVITLAVFFWWSG